MPKISQAQGASHEGVIAEHDAELRDDARVDVQEPIPVKGEPVDYNELTVKQLSAEIEKRNRANGTEIPTTGNKADLVARLEADDEGDEDETGE